MSASPPRKRTILSFFTGTRPGLEGLLFATVPALIAGSVAYFVLGGWAGLGIGFAVLLVVARLARRIGDVPESPSEAPAAPGEGSRGTVRKGEVSSGGYESPRSADSGYRDEG